MEYKISQEAVSKELNTVGITQKFLGLPSSNSRTLGWYSDNARTDGMHVYSSQLERVHLSERLFLERSIYLGERTDSGWKRKRQSTASSLLCNSELFSWKSRWRRTPWWFRSSSESALSQSLETASRCRLVGKIVKSTRFGIANLANNVICDHHPQSCVRRLHLQSNLWENRRSSIVRNTLNLKANTQSYAEKQVACAAAVGAYLQWSYN